MAKGRPCGAALRLLRGSETGAGLTVGRDGSHLPCSPVPGLDSAWWPRATNRPHGPYVETDPVGGPPQRPDLAARHLQRPVKHGIQVRTTSFLR